MGQKGDKQTSEAQLSCNLFVEKLSPISGIASKKMFGGHGIFHEGKMFGIIDAKGQAYLKTDDNTEAFYIEKGSARHGKMPYYAVPNETLNSTAELLELAKEAIAINK